MDRGKGKGTSVHTAVYVPKHYMQGNMECIDAIRPGPVSQYITGDMYACMQRNTYPYGNVLVST